MRREHLFGRCPTLRINPPRIEQAAAPPASNADDADRPAAPATAKAED